MKKMILFILFLVFFNQIMAQGINQCRYWVNDNFNNVTTININKDSGEIQLNLAYLNSGYYQISFQFKDTTNKWSSVVTEWFNKAPITSSKTTAYRYWFDNNFSAAKTVLIQSNKYENIYGNIDVESISLGRHLANIQFQDSTGKWSSIVSDSITRNPITSKVFIQPKLLTAKASLNVGQTQTITGTDFTPNGQIDLLIQNSEGDYIPTNNSFTYLAVGKFSYQLPVTASMPDGDYQAYARDINTGVTSPVIKFRVNNAVPNKLFVVAPKTNGYYEANKPLQIQWSDFISNANAVGNTGFIQKKYSIEYSNNNGASWQTIINNYTVNNAFANRSNTFKYNYTFANAGNYLVRVSDASNSTNNDTSANFAISIPSTTNFTANLEWDTSFPKTSGMPLHPIGLAADGTSRLFIHLVRGISNTKTIASIAAQITSPNGYSDTSLLGKIMFATNYSTYSEEANAAQSTTVTKTFVTPSNGNDFYFWLVAPNDFTQNITNDWADRTLDVSFVITYSDNSTFNYTQPNIYIVRPPLMLVHGLNGSSMSWDKAKFSLDGVNTYYFNPQYVNGHTIKNPFFKNDLAAVTLVNYASFIDNAQILLGTNGITYNSFAAFIQSMRRKGYSCNKVDYVCHSMGGCIARTAINKYPNIYSPSESSTLLFKNYGKGFINKFITLNTPHNGSPVADFMADFFVPTNSISDYTKNNVVDFAYNHFDFFKGFFRPAGTEGSGLFSYTKYNVSPAVKDLQATHNGIAFGITRVKNHLIGSNIDKYGILSAADLIGQLHNDASVKHVLDLIDLLIPGTNTVINNITKGPDLVYRINNYFNTRYGYYQFLSNSDAIVPTSNQFPGLLLSSIPDETQTAPNRATYATGFKRNHMMITDDLGIGTKVMQLLNAPINSSYFSSQIAPNLNGSGTIYREASTTSASDSIINKIDTIFIKIISPSHFASVFVDSIIDLKILVKDTSKLQKIKLVFQGEYYESYSKTANQTFNVKVHSDAIGYNSIVVDGVYDSVGYTINHNDTTTLLIKSLDTVKGFYTIPKSQNLNKNQAFNQTNNAVFTKYVGVLNNNADSLGFVIADTNVVKFIDSTRQFTTKDTGTTYILFKYRNFTDTAFIYVSDPEESNVIVPVLLSSFTASAQCNLARLNWQTATEINNFGFDVEQSTDGITFQKIAFINGNGNTGKPFSYKYDVNSLKEGNYFYRLKQIDYDGHFTFSQVILLNVKCKDKQTINAYPNPSKGKFDLVITDVGVNHQNLVVDIYDVNSKKVKTIKVDNYTSGNNLPINLSALASGNYFIQVKYNNQVVATKVEIVK